MKRQNAGYSLIEVLVASLMMVIIGGGMIALVNSGYTSQSEILGQNTANADSRKAVDELADHIRGAQINGTNDGPLILAAAQEIKFYDYYDYYDKTQAHSLVPIRYWVSSGSLLQQVNSLPASGKVVISNLRTSGATFAFTYFTYSGSSWTSASSSATPYNVGAVGFSVPVVTYNGARTIAGSVRIRTKVYP